MNDQIQFKSDEITLKEFRSFSPFGNYAKN